MGTSVRMIECHYGSLLQGSADSIRAKLGAHAEGWAKNGPRETSEAPVEASLTRGYGVFPGVAVMGATGLEPVTPSLSSWCSPN